MKFTNEVIDKVIVDLGDVNVSKVRNQVIIQFEFIILVHLRRQFPTGDFPFLGRL